MGEHEKERRGLSWTRQDMLTGGPSTVELEWPGWAFVAEEVEFYNANILRRIQQVIHTE